MSTVSEFSTLLTQFVQRDGRRMRQLAQATAKQFSQAVSHSTISRWLGDKGKPRHWEDLVKVAIVLRLTRSETDALLQAAQHPDLTTLAAVEWALAATRLSKAGDPHPLQAWRVHLQYVTNRALRRRDERAACWWPMRWVSISGQCVSIRRPALTGSRRWRFGRKRWVTTILVRRNLKRLG